MRWQQVAPVRSHLGAVATAHETPVDATDETRTALRPCPLSSQPEPELAPVPQDDLPEPFLVQAARGERAPAAPEPGRHSVLLVGEDTVELSTVEDSRQPALGANRGLVRDMQHRHSGDCQCLM